MFEPFPEYILDIQKSLYYFPQFFFNVSYMPDAILECLTPKYQVRIFWSPRRCISPIHWEYPPFKTNFRFLKGGYSYKKFHFWNFYFQTQSICFFSISDKNLAKNLKYEWNIAIQCNFQRNALRKLQLLENISSKSSKKFVYKGDVFEIEFHNS